MIILLDDVGFGVVDTFGGPVHTPTLSRMAEEGISYNTFNTTSICSPTRAALLTGRNHQRVGSGTIAERAVNWDGYTGVIPPTSATLPKVLGYYGYTTAAFGKWHNTAATQTTAMGPFTLWPTGQQIGFDYFYGFLAGETSQWEPRLVENFNQSTAARPEYHLSQPCHKAIAGRASTRPSRQTSLSSCTGRRAQPTAPITSSNNGQTSTNANSTRLGCATRAHVRASKRAWLNSANAKLTPRDKTMASWDSIPASERAFQERLMEVFAGFAEHVDVQAGKLIDELDRLGLRKNTIVFYIVGDNGSSAEGQQGTISELLV